MNEQDLIKALGPLAPIYSDPDVLEIMVDAYDRVYVERQGKGLEDVPAPFDSPEALRATIDAVLTCGGVTLSAEQTSGEVLFPNGSRFLAVLPPTAISGPCFVLRKLTKPLTWDNMFEYGVLTREAYEVLEGAMRGGVNVLVGGGAGSGKTTIANLLVELIPADERVIIAEPIYEMQVRHPRSIHLAGHNPANVSFEKVLMAAARMRPDWLVAGELHGPQAALALQIFGHGHNGLATIHAGGIEDALARAEAIGLMANLGLGLGEIRRMIAAAFQLIVYQEKLPGGFRRITHIVELRGIENERYVLQPLFRYNEAKDKLEATGAQPGWEK